MELSKIEAGVKEMIAEELALNPEQIAATATFEELKADSLAMMSLVLKLEDYFQMTVGDDVIKQIKTVQDVIDYVQRCQQAAA